MSPPQSGFTIDRVQSAVVLGIVGMVIAVISGFVIDTRSDIAGISATLTEKTNRTQAEQLNLRQWASDLQKSHAQMIATVAEHKAYIDNISPLFQDVQAIQHNFAKYQTYLENFDVALQNLATLRNEVNQLRESIIAREVIETRLKVFVDRMDNMEALLKRYPYTGTGPH